ncbi:MAG: RIP metalloprotease RseP [Ignavibacteriales bacterium]|nr:RIP metalloprotease RseP [Ignavibacteriales bacterium]
MIVNEVLYFIITIGILVFVHEFGHFAAAKLSGMRADVFAIGFGYRLFGWNKITGFSFGELAKDFDGGGNTDYRLCLLPLGGYVKIPGMVDESGDVSFADKEPQPWEFRAKSTSKKVFVITAGVLMNLILAYLIFFGSNLFIGKSVTKTTTIGFVEPGSPAEKSGFVENDKIISINGKAVSYWEEIRNEIFISTMGQNLTVEVERNGARMPVHVDRKIIPTDESKALFLMTEKLRPVVADILKGSPADSAKIQANDILLSINGATLHSIKQTIETISHNKEQAVALKVLREKDTVSLTALPGKDGKLGIMLGGYAFLGQTERKTQGFLGSLSHGATDLVKTVNLTFVMIKRVFTGEIAFGKAFGGPIKIAQFAAKSADSGVSSFLMFIGLLSLSLAILNILPIPALDGGHLIMILIEGIIKREIPIKIKIAVQNTGFILLLLLMAFILYNDFLSL